MPSVHFEYSVSSLLKCGKFDGSFRSAMIGFQLCANDLRLRLGDQSKPTRSINRIEYQYGADTLLRRTFNGGEHVDKAHPFEGPSVLRC